MGTRYPSLRTGFRFPGPTEKPDAIAQVGTPRAPVRISGAETGEFRNLQASWSGMHGNEQLDISLKQDGG